MRHEWQRAMIGFFSLVISLTGTVSRASAQDDVAAGATVFVQTKCGNCHGKTGKGDGPTTKRSNLKLIDWTDTAAMASLTDPYMTDIIAKGGKAIGKSGRMPRYEHKLSAAQIQQLVAYIRSLGVATAPTAPVAAAPVAAVPTPAAKTTAAAPPTVSTMPIAADPPPSASATTPVAVASPPPTSETIPAAVPPTVPAAPDPTAPPLLLPDPEIGAQLFAELKCAKCHGKTGTGNGPLARRMKLTLKDWTEATAMSQLTDDNLTDLIANGGKLSGKSKWMPLYRHQTDKAGIQHLVAYCRSLAPAGTDAPNVAPMSPPGSPPQGASAESQSSLTTAPQPTLKQQRERK